MQTKVKDFTKRKIGELKLEFMGISGDVSNVKIKSVSLKKDKKISSIINHLRNKLKVVEGVNIKDKDILGHSFQYTYNNLVFSTGNQVRS